MKKNMLKWVWVGVLSTALVGCGGDSDDMMDGGDAGVEDIEIAGSWMTNFDTMETISNTEWQEFINHTVVKFDNELNYAIRRNPLDDEFNPGKFSRVEWLEPTAAGFYHCSIANGEDTAEDAENSTNMADASDLDDIGCGGFPWTMLSPVAE